MLDEEEGTDTAFGAVVTTGVDVAAGTERGATAGSDIDGAGTGNAFRLRCLSASSSRVVVEIEATGPE